MQQQIKQFNSEKQEITDYMDELNRNRKNSQVSLDLIVKIKLAHSLYALETKRADLEQRIMAVAKANAQLQSKIGNNE